MTSQWREALLCRSVIVGRTTGYKTNPHVLRIMKHTVPYIFINRFLYEIFNEGKKREFKFDENKLIPESLTCGIDPMDVTEDQLEYEFNLIQSLMPEFHKQRSLNEQYFNEEWVIPNDLFITVPGPIMDFEKI